MTGTKMLKKILSQVQKNPQNKHKKVHFYQISEEGVVLAKC